MRKALTFDDFRAFVLDDMMDAAGFQADGQYIPWTWSAAVVEHLDLLVCNMHRWIDCVHVGIGKQYNCLNPVNTLPVEVLCMIFAATGAADNIEEQLTLASVCRHWRSVAMGNSALWSKINIDNRYRLSPQVGLELEWRLARAEPAPVSLYFRSHMPWADARLADSLLLHMYHIRSLELDVHHHILTRDLRNALTMPAPCLSKLSIEAYSEREALGGPVVCPLPDNLFSGDAPRLQQLLLTNFQPPLPTWSPLRNIERFTLKAWSLEESSLVAALLCCPQLRFLALDIEYFQVDEAGPVPLDSMLQSQHMAIKFNLGDTSIFTIQAFLAHIHCRDPKHLFISIVDRVDAAAWFMASALECGIQELDLHDCRKSARAFVVTAVARTSAGKARAAVFKLHSLVPLAPLFRSLCHLTIVERMWPREYSPDMPDLHTLTVVLEHPVLSMRDTTGAVGLFFLSLHAGNAWYLPGLRTLKLAFKDPCVDPRTGRPPRSGGPPLVVSAYDIATFLTWHLRSDRRLTLVLQNVKLFEPQHSAEVQRLKALLDELVIEPHFSPEPADVHVDV